MRPITPTDPPALTRDARDPATPQAETPPHDLAAAFGIMLGIMIGAVIWLYVAAAAFWLLPIFSL